jgi:hypothetical protein
MEQPHAITLEGTRFWVRHRRRTYGPFDYEWSPDFCGMELLYNGEKFGEYCSREEIFADLKAFQLPMSVVSVTAIVMGCVIAGVLNGLNPAERQSLLDDSLATHGFAHFVCD